MSAPFAPSEESGQVSPEGAEHSLPLRTAED